MNCPSCKEYLEASRCPSCGYDLNRGPWICIKNSYPPDDLILVSLLRSHGIPVKTRSREVSQIPVGIGPLAETNIYVPEIIAGEASALIDIPDSEMD
ncbi:MAG: hypothetical protein GX119_06405 [Syntrophomonadaceae bacterium]|jgi:hypothetical protein|nr:hypothetical protein [Syntrophomonadaceae bacterium]